MVAAVLHDRASCVVSLPESAIEYRCQPLFQCGGQFRRVVAVFHGPERPVVTFDHAFDVFRTPRTPFDLEDPHARFDEVVEKVDRAEVFGREDVAPVDVQRRTGLRVRDGVFAAAQLAAGSAVGRAVGFVEREVAFTRNRHA